MIFRISNRLLLATSRITSWYSDRRWRQVQTWPTDELGHRGEQVAARYLKRRGHRIIARRYRTLLGELDLVSVDVNRAIVFVEVKTRRGTPQTRPAEAIDQRKQRRIIRAAWEFLSHHRLRGYGVRYDIVTVIWSRGNHRPQIRHEASAFSPLED